MLFWLLWGTSILSVVGATYDNNDWDTAAKVVTPVGYIRVAWDGVIEGWRNVDVAQPFLLWRTELPIMIEPLYCQTACACQDGSPCVSPLNAQLTSDGRLFRKARDRVFPTDGVVDPRHPPSRRVRISSTLVIDPFNGNILPLNAKERSKGWTTSKDVVLYTKENLVVASIGSDYSVDQLWNCTFTSLEFEISNKAVAEEENAKIQGLNEERHDIAKFVALFLGISLGCFISFMVWLFTKCLKINQIEDLSRRAAVLHAIEWRRISVPTIADDGSISCGVITLNPAEKLGDIVAGVELFAGCLEDGRHVAVKRINRSDMAECEVGFMTRTEDLKHVAKYYALEEDSNYLYFAMTPCKMTLESWIQMRRAEAEKTGVLTLTSELVTMMLSITKGLKWLHSNGILLGDVAPTRIIVDSSGTARICHFGYSGNDATGWIAPEMIKNGEQAVSTASDVFSLGCLFQCMAVSLHPFGTTPEERERNILSFKPDFSSVSMCPILLHLVQIMIRLEPQQRALVTDVEHHMFFWNERKKVEFICTVFERLDTDQDGLTAKNELEQYMKQIPELQGWRDKLPPCLFDEVQTKHLIDYTTQVDILRLIRNKSRHFRDISDEEKKFLVNNQGIFTFFNSRFPALFICVYEFISHTLSHEPCFSNLYY